MNQKRIQLTLFVDENQSATIEKIRREFNPIQYDLIKSHVTLCREDELEKIEEVKRSLIVLNHGPITIEFGNMVRFSEGKGLMIPAFGENEPFQKLRANILKGIIEHPRKQEPHITLMHPRNSTCNDAIFEQVKAHDLPRKIEFNKISLIEQEMGKQWHILEEFELKTMN
ncbi:MAG: 2'-5' RNA ligase family protein [Saprospiraceae bacterium]|nr:2'-5' RNA ligase family protein [Saprospiraceae bacterium]